MRKWNINWVYLVAAILLAAAVYAAALAFFPAWAQSVKLLVVLAVLVVVGVVAFLANVRQPLEPSPPSPIGTANAPVTDVEGDKVEGNKIVEQHAQGDIVGHDKVMNQIIQAPPKEIQGLHQLPPQLADFTGRQSELAELRKAIHDGVTVIGLGGLGGVGKTALALVLAHEMAGDYPDAQIFLNMQGVPQPLGSEDITQPLTIPFVMTHVIRAYQPVGELPKDPAQLAGIYRSTLTGQRALLLLDNAAGPAQVEDLIPPPGCLFLVTSRTQFKLPGLRALDLYDLEPSDAQALLLKICPRIGDHAGDLAKLCGCLPLALRLAATALAEFENLGVVPYIRFLKAEHSRLKKLDKVEASFALSYNLLSGELQRLWRLLAVFPVDFDEPAAAAVWQLDADTSNGRLGHLLRYSLLEYDVKSRRYHLHNLARDFAHSRLSDTERVDGQRRHAEHYKDILKFVKALSKPSVGNLGLSLYYLERTNILAGQAWAAKHAGDDDPAARLASDYGDEVWRVPLQDNHEQIVWLEAALAGAQRLKDRKAEVLHLSSLGFDQFGRGKRDLAIEYYRKGLAISREIGDQHSECGTLVNLGIIYSNLGQRGRAVQCFEQALPILRKIRDSEIESIVTWALQQEYTRQGEFSKARALGNDQILAYALSGDWMPGRVDWRAWLDIPSNETHAAGLEALRARLAGRS